MSDESDVEKTEPASPRRLEKAREDGQVARSTELVTFSMLAAAFGSLWLFGPSLGAHFTDSLRGGLLFERATVFDTERMMIAAGRMSLDAILAMAPYFVGLLAVAAVAPALLSGWLVSTKPLVPNLGKLNPLKGLKRMVSLDALTNLLKAKSKAIVIGTVGTLVIYIHLPEMLALPSEPLDRALMHMAKIVILCCAITVGSLLLIAMIDVPLQLWQHGRKLRMSQDDLRREHKDTDGDPHVKARIRQQQRALSRRRMMEEVPQADVIVTNPTHYAVALRYSEDNMGAPRVIAKGAEAIAMRIREIGAGANVPILEAPPLARALYRHVEVGHEIPAALYKAVAEILAWVFELRKLRAEGGDLTQARAAPSQIPIPAELDPHSAPATRATQLNGNDA